MEKIKNSKFVQNLKRQAEENPVYVIGAAATLMFAVSKLMDANTSRNAQKMHAREIERREFQTYQRRTR